MPVDPATAAAVVNIGSKAVPLLRNIFGKDVQYPFAMQQVLISGKDFSVRLGASTVLDGGPIAAVQQAAQQIVNQLAAIRRSRMRLKGGALVIGYNTARPGDRLGTGWFTGPTASFTTGAESSGLTSASQAIYQATVATVNRLRQVPPAAPSRSPPLLRPPTVSASAPTAPAMPAAPVMPSMDSPIQFLSGGSDMSFYPTATTGPNMDIGVQAPNADLWSMIAGGLDLANSIFNSTGPATMSAGMGNAWLPSVLPAIGTVVRGAAGALPTIFRGAAGAAAAGAIGAAIYDAAGNLIGYQQKKKARHMNPLNVKAARRAIKRICGVRTVCHSIESQLPTRGSPTRKRKARCK